MPHQYANTPENLEILAEECGEIIEILLRVMQIKAKVIRFGFDDCHPEKPGVTNRDRLEQELGHLQAMVKVLIANGTVSQEGIDAGERHKFDKLPLWYGRSMYPPGT